MKKSTILLAAAFVVVISIVLSCGMQSREDKVYIINSEYSFAYSFPKKPKLGTNILKVSLFKEHEKVRDLDVAVFYNMPSCSTHRVGKTVAMQLNRDNDYLTPMDFTMRGTWEVTITFKQNDEDLHSEKILVKI